MCWRRMDISWNDHGRDKDVLHRVKAERNILHIKRRKVNCIGHVLCRKDRGNDRSERKTRKKM